MLEAAHELGECRAVGPWSAYTFAGGTWHDETYGNRNTPFIDNNSGDYLEVTYSTGPHGECWHRHRRYMQSAPTNGTTLVLLLNASDAAVARVFQNANKIRLEVFNGSSWVLLSEAATDFIVPSSLSFIDVHFNNDVSGEFTLYIDDALSECTYTGDLSAYDPIAKVRTYTASTNDVSIGEQIFGDESTIAHRYVCVPATGNGNYTAATGDYLDVDEDGIDTATNVTFATAGDRETFTHSAMSSLPSGAIKTVQVTGYVANAATGPQNVKASLRIGTTDYDQAAAYAGIGTGYTVYRARWDQNPSTVAAWVQADAVNVAMEFGYKAEA